MKNILRSMVAVVVLCLLSSAALAKKKHPEFNYDRIGHVIRHAEEIRYLLEGRDDLYYSGDYICTPGTEHYAPDCRENKDWYATKTVAYSEYQLEDGSAFVIPIPPRLACGLDLDKKCMEPWKHGGTVTVCQLHDPDPARSDLCSDLIRAITSTKDGQETFRYAVDQAGQIHVDRHPDALDDLYRKLRNRGQQ